MTTNQTYVLSIEPVDGKSFRYGFHLGTNLALAKEIAAEKFHARNKSYLPTRTVALFRGNDMVDVFDGLTWSSGLVECDCAAETEGKWADVHSTGCSLILKSS